MRVKPRKTLRPHPGNGKGQRAKEPRFQATVTETGESRFVPPSTGNVIVVDSGQALYEQVKDSLFYKEPDIPRAPDTVSIRELATLVGTDKAHMWRILTGAKRPSLRLAYRLMVALRLPHTETPTAQAYRLMETLKHGDPSMLRTILDSPVTIIFNPGTKGGKGKHADTIRAEDHRRKFGI